MATGYSTNLVVHAFATTARDRRHRRGARHGRSSPPCGWTSARTAHDRRVVRRRTSTARPRSSGSCACASSSPAGAAAGRPDGRACSRPAPGASGAAFQKVNFLRDLAADCGGLGPRLLPRRRPGRARRAERSTRLLDDIDADLAAAAAALPLLPAGRRRAVALAHGLFAELAARIRATPAEPLLHHARPGARSREGCASRARRRRRTRSRRRTHERGVAPSSSAAASAGSRRPRCWPADGLRRRAARGAGRRRRPRGGVGRRRLPLRHRPVVVPDAGGVRPLLPAARHHARTSSSSCSRSTPATASCSSGDGPPPRSSTSRRTASANLALSSGSSRAPGRGSTRYLDSAALGLRARRSASSSTRRSTTCGRCSPATCVARPAAARADCSLQSARTATSTRRFRDRRLAQILQYPAVFLGTSPVHDAEHVPPDEHARPRRRRAATRWAASPRVIERDRGAQAEQRGRRDPHGARPPTRILTDGRAGGRPTVPASAPRARARRSSRRPWSSARWTCEAAERDAAAAGAPQTYGAELVGEARPRAPARCWCCSASAGELPELLHHTLLFTEGLATRTSTP